MKPDVSRAAVREALEDRVKIEIVERVSFDYMVFYYSEFNFYMVLN